MEIVTLEVYGGKTTIIDVEDFWIVEGLKFHLATKGYVQTWIKGKTRRLHQLIMHHTDKSKVIDHINGDKLDNRKENLRLCTNAENCRNGKRKGVYWNKARKKWHTRITKDYKRMHLGFHKTEEEALFAYNEAAKTHFGEFAYLNTGVK